MIREAEGEKASRTLRAEGEAESIRQIAQAKDEGEAVVLEKVLSTMKNADIDSNILALKSMDALEKVANGNATKLVLPSETVSLLGTFKGIKEVMSDNEKNKN